MLLGLVLLTKMHIFLTIIFTIKITNQKPINFG